MINWLGPALLAPTIAAILSISGTIIVYRSMRSQAWGVKRWLIFFMFCWVPWSITTILMRITHNELHALYYLRVSFIFLQLAFFSIYKFHHLIAFKTTDARYSTFGIAILVGFNSASVFNTNMVSVIHINDYYTDVLSIPIQLGNLFLAIWAGYISFVAMRELDFFSTFYTTEGKRIPGHIIIAFIILMLTFTILVVWIAQVGTGGVNLDSTRFIFFSWLVIIYFTITYGIRPLSAILSPQRIWAFLLINSVSGIPIYTKTYGKGTTNTDFLLFSGAMSASNTMLQIYLNSKTDVNLVTMENRAVMLEKRDNLYFCLIVDHNSAQFEILLKELIKVITNHEDFKILHPDNPMVDTRFIDPILTDLLEV